MPKHLFIDIETVPQQQSFQLLDETWQSLFLQKNEKFIQDEQLSYEEAYNQKAGILSEFGKIICISIGYLSFDKSSGKRLLKIKNITHDNEKIILNNFISIVETFAQKSPSFKFVGHNIKEFDIPYICRRLIVHGMPLPTFLPAYDAKPWETNCIDTLHWWRFGDYKSYISLNLLAHVLNVPTSKTDISGSDVRNVYYESNDLQRIATYCAKDVWVVANLYLRYTQQTLITEDAVCVVEDNKAS